MHSEEIIHSWKKEPAGRAFPSNEEPEKQPAQAPTNPAGEQELSDEELALIEGGSGVCTCTREDSCIHPA